MFIIIHTVITVHRTMDTADNGALTAIIITLTTVVSKLADGQSLGKL